jgi:hypothetical protein
VLHPRDIELGPDARMALAQILGIMTDQVFGGETAPMWDVERLMELESRLGITLGVDDVGRGGDDTTTVTLGIDDAALLLDGMAFTEIASADLPWIDMVRWTSDFVTGELRQHWTSDEWQAFSAGLR